jgi:hypothetical protein
MSEYINLGDVTYFGITITHPSGGFLTNADETPRYFIYKNASDTPLVSANFIARAGLTGTYRGSGDITTGNSFAAGDYVEVHASGKVSGLVGRAIIKTFVVADTFNANIVQWSGSSVKPANNNNPSVNVVSLTGVPLPGAIINANILQYGGIQGYQSGGIPSVNTVYWADSPVELDAQFSKPVVSAFSYYDPQTSTYRAYPIDFTNLSRLIPSAILNASLTNYTLNGSVGSGIGRMAFNIIDANVVQLSGHNLANTFNNTIQQAVWAARMTDWTVNNTTGSGLGRSALNTVNANLIQWSGSPVKPANNGHPPVNLMDWGGFGIIPEVDNDVASYPRMAAARYYDNSEGGERLFPPTFYDTYNKQVEILLSTNISAYVANGTIGSGLNKISQNIYYAGIKLVKDSVNLRDEYLVQWFRNSLPISSGEISNPALSVYKTSDGSALTQNNPLAITSVNNGVLRYNETSNLVVSGEPYLVATSGIIDGGLRVWNNPVGIDSL